MKKISQRAAAGGGKEMTVSVGASYQLGGNPNVGLGGNMGSGAGWFGPGEPMTPQAPPEVKGRAFDFPQAVNLFTTQQATKPITFATLRAFADSYDLLRIIIETRKDAMERLGWVIQSKDPKEKLTPQRRNKIKAITEFFNKPDGEHCWSDWLRMVLEDLFVVDAVTLHRRRTRGGKLISLDQIDGATMRRVLDDWGRTPEDPTEVCYQQILKGMPAVDYLKDEIFYRPRNLRIHKIYGFSPVEQIMMTINIALRRQVFQLNFFTEGNVPASLIGVPETWTPDQIRTFQEWFDAINAGNLAERRRARFVPNAVGKTYIPTQETELFGLAEEWMARVICFAFSISPLPFIKMMNRATSQQSGQEADANGLSPIKSWVKGLIDQVLSEDMDAADFEFMWKTDNDLDPTKRQQITSGYLRDGLITINEGRVDAGREPYDDPIYDKPMFITANGLAPLTLDPSRDYSADPLQDPGDDPSASDPAGGNDPMATGAVGGSKSIRKLHDLTTQGDPDLLAAFLRELAKETVI